MIDMTKVSQSFVQDQAQELNLQFDHDGAIQDERYETLPGQPFDFYDEA